MPTHEVLLLGGTGRTGGRVLAQLLQRGLSVRAIVRSAHRLPAEVARHPALTVIEADLLGLGDEDLARHARGCDAVVSCLGHVISFKGVFGPPHDLVTQATVRFFRAIEAARPESPVKFILLSSVSVNCPADAPRPVLDRLVLWILRGLVPPTRDNQRAADFLRQAGAGNRFVQWVVVRPDSLLDGMTTEYLVRRGIQGSLFKPDSTNMANVAHFMCELATDPSAWDRWAGKLPVIINTPPSNS